MLVIVHDRDIQFVLQATFDLEGFGCLDIFQVYPPESRCDPFDRIDELVHILGVDLNVEHINVGKYLKEQTLPFHDRLGSLGSNITQPQNCSTIRDHCDQVALVGVAIDVVRLLLYLQARLGYSGRIGKGKIPLSRVLLGRNDLYLSRTGFSVV